jgi:uncharacterized protein (DUF488 family)
LRADLSNADSYKRLLDKYQTEMLPLHEHDVERLAAFMAETAAVLVCFERDVRFCHRGRLAEALSARTGLKETHLCL